MAELTNYKYLDLTGLQHYDSKIKAWIEAKKYQTEIEDLATIKANATSGKAAADAWGVFLGGTDISKPSPKLSELATKDELSTAITNLKNNASTGYDTLGGLETKIKEVARSVTDKNVTASGDDYVTATATDNAVTISATQKLKDAVTAAEGAKDYADGLNSAMDGRVKAVEGKSHEHSNKDELDKIAVGDKDKWDNAATAINDFLTGTDTDDVVNKLSDIKNWMDESGKDVTDLSKAIADETDARIAGDNAINDKLGGDYDKTNTVAKAIEGAISTAKDYTDDVVITAEGDNDGTYINVNATVEGGRKVVIAVDETKLSSAFDAISESIGNINNHTHSSITTSEIDAMFA